MFVMQNKLFYFTGESLKRSHLLESSSDIINMEEGEISKVGNKLIN